jgi:hypothetical protein
MFPLSPNFLDKNNTTLNLLFYHESLNPHFCEGDTDGEHLRLEINNLGGDADYVWARVCVGDGFQITKIDESMERLSDKCFSFKKDNKFLHKDTLKKYVCVSGSGAVNYLIETFDVEYGWHSKKFKAPTQNKNIIQLSHFIGCNLNIPYGTIPYPARISQYNFIE